VAGVPFRYVATWRTGASVACVAVLLVVGYPGRALAEDNFCPAGQTPQLGERFKTVAAAVGARVGEPLECEHVEVATGDVQQRTAQGLLYSRKSTALPTFTNGGEHWAVRGSELLSWPNDSVDPPPDAAFVPLPLVADTAAAAAAPSVVGAGDAFGAASMFIFLGAAVVVLVLLALLVLLASRRNPRASASGGTQMQLASSTAPVQEMQGLIHDVGRGQVTPRAGEVLYNTDEGMVWHETPSVVTLLPLVLKVAISLLVAVFVANLLPAAVLVSPVRGLPVIPTLVAVLGLLTIAYRFADLRATVYRLSSQRLEIEFGLLNQTTVVHEVHHLGDAIIRRPLLFRLFGVGDVHIPDVAPGSVRAITLHAIRKPEAVRDILRGAGQIEAQRVDKIRWR
jgi:hypothetical protein